MKTFLIGLPGSGKTTMGREVARILNREFVDLDQEIVRGEGKPVTQLFGTLGEFGFRKLEESYLTNWCKRSVDFIMATGGGTPCFFQNIQLINANGVSIFLDTNINTIAERMLNTELAKRPLFSGETNQSIAQRIATMRKERISFYEQAKLTLTEKLISARSIADYVLSLER